MKKTYTVYDGCIILSNGAGRGSTTLERDSFLGLDISEAFKTNSTYLEMQKAAKAMNKYNNNIILLAFILAISVGLLAIGLSNNVMGFILAVPALVVILLLTSFLEKRNIGLDKISNLVVQPLVSETLRTYFDTFVETKTSNFSNSIDYTAPRITGFKVETKADNTNLASREIKLSGRAWGKEFFTDIELVINFNPEYYNLKLIEYTIGGT